MNTHKHWYNPLYDEAVQAKSFKSLLPYPCLLVRWQIEHKNSPDYQSIARISSHKLSHKLCGDKCHLIDLWMRKVLIQSMGIIFLKRAGEIEQLSLL